jgi:hypothetical protein
MSVTNCHIILYVIFHWLHWLSSVHSILHYYNSWLWSYITEHAFGFSSLNNCGGWQFWTTYLGRLEAPPSVLLPSPSPFCSSYFSNFFCDITWARLRAFLWIWSTKSFGSIVPLTVHFWLLKSASALSTPVNHICPSNLSHHHCLEEENVNRFHSQKLTDQWDTIPFIFRIVFFRCLAHASQCIWTFITTIATVVWGQTI